MFDPDPDIAAFVQALPKTETHLHLEGACPLSLLEEVAPGKYPDGPPMWNDSFRYKSFYEFMDIYAECCGLVFNRVERYAEAARLIFEDCLRQNCRYVETSFHMGVLLSGEISGPELVDAVLGAVPDGLEVRLFMGMCHNDYHGMGKEIIDASLKWERLYGIDLHGPEDLPLEPWTAEVWRRAKDEGKFLKAHAGEFMPASFVRRCVEELGVRRIQHGVRSVEDPAVVEMLKREKVALDVCPISNLKLQVEGVTSMAKHPIRELFDAGVVCTINSDDPFMFGNTLSEEYYALYQELGFTKRELARIALNGFEIAEWNGPEKENCIAEIETIMAACGEGVGRI